MTFFNDGNQTENEADQDFVAKVVEAKGENWKDPKVIAKGYIESQKYIDRLQAELEEAKAKANQADYAKEILERLDAAKGKPTIGDAASTSNGTEKQVDQPVLVETIKGLIKQTITEEEAAQSRSKNLQEADRQLTALFGTEAQKTVTERAAKLGMSKDDLTEIAAKSPSAFLALIGETPVKATNATKTSTINTSASSFEHSGQKDWAYYQKMRRENPKLYRSPQIQKQILEDRMRLGDRFYA